MNSQVYSLKEKTASYCLSALLMLLSLSYFINLLLQDCFKTGISVSALFYAPVFLIGVSTFAFFTRRLKMMTFIIVFFMILGTILYFALYPGYTKLVFTSLFDLAYNPMIRLFVYCIPVLLLTSSGDIKYEIVLKTTKIISRVIIVLLIVCYFIYGVGMSTWQGQYMSTSYSAMPAICILIVSFTRKEDFYKSDGILALFGLFITLIGGSRGALICEVIYIIILIMISPNTSKKTKTILYVLTVVFIVFLLTYFDKVLLLLEAFVSSKGMSSRILEKMSSHSFYTSNDRLELWNTVIDAIWRSPIIGYGLWGDRPIVNGYSHNLFLELLCSFGIFFGSIIIIMLIASIIQYLISAKSKPRREYDFFLIALPYGLFQLMVSDSYLFNQWFFVLIGIIICNSKMGRQKSI